ncbi:ABC transporter ATP-binding protein [Pleionea sediminis]|uniref:ABC transporter ATP-binding protein n=1 Tax=Pleionea sediminis TaxID=2569479 RepID=UPI0011870FB9|nr:ABC transporter ATP-binding protein [Pleionea sediminis]
MLEVCDLMRRYDDFTAVENVSFTIGKGEIVGLLGHNGAGKTTIMKMLSGFLEPDHGSVHLDGIDLAKEPRKVQASLGYLPENLPIYPEMTVADYLDYAANLKGLSDEEKRDEVKRAISATELMDKLLAPIATLSRGYKQRVGVAQAILGRPKLLILDEPTNGLDPEQTQHMRQLIRDIAKDATVILSTHIMQEVEALCSRVIILGQGQLVVDEELHALKNSNRVWIKTSLNEQQAQSLASIEGVANVEIEQSSKEGDSALWVGLKNEVEQRKVRATIAKRIIEMGAELYELRSEERNLESLFKQVSEHSLSHKELNNGGLKNAA